MKLLHSADWHLDSPFTGRPEAQSWELRRALLEVPGKIAALCREEGCDMLLLSGDLFDGGYSRAGLDAARAACEEAAVPVLISPGNHDFCGMNSPYIRESWPGNVHIFRHPYLESVTFPELDCRVYGAGYDSMDCPGLLEGFRAEGKERYAIGLLHGDTTQLTSPYCPVTAAQVRESGLDYLALGHIHKSGSFRAGNTLCAWPGCPMGRGYDEVGEKGALIVTLGEQAKAEFRVLDTPRFFDLEADAGDDPKAALSALLPPGGSRDCIRVTLTGYCPGFDPGKLRSEYANCPNLELRDRTVPEADLWGSVGDDSLEGVYFRMLHDAMDGQSESARRCLRLAAEISRRILDGQEVQLP